MKRYLLLASSVSVLCAGPLVKPLVDYDKVDKIEAEQQVEQKLVLPMAEPPVVTMPGVRKKSFRYELDLLAGRNFTDSGSVLKDATTMGIRLNRYISDDVAIQIGYDRIFDADYKFGKKLRALRNNAATKTLICSDDEGVQHCCTCVPCPDQGDNDEGTDQGSDNGDNGSDEGYDNGDTNNGSDNGGTDTGTGDIGGGSNGNEGTGGGDGGSGNTGGGSTPGNGSGNGGNGDAGGGSTPGNGGENGGNDNGEGAGSNGDNPLSTQGLRNATRSTDVDRFYLNALKEIHSEKSRLIPFFFAGVGYEHVNDKNLGIDSQGFVNAGGGLKYSLGEKFRLVSEAKAIKKFKDDDVDIVAMVGLGMMLGEKEQAPQSDLPEIDQAEPKPQQQDLSLVILDDTPTAAPEAKPAIDRTPVVKALLAEESAPKPAMRVATSDNAYYIQVAVVTTEKGMNEYTSKLANSGLNYEVKPLNLHGKEGHRVLAGPYLSREEAAHDLSSVKKIERGAFIKKM